MNIFAEFKAELAAILQNMVEAGDLPADVTLDGVTVEPPRDPSHGDIATNAALVLAGRARKNPRELAAKLEGPLAALPGVEAVSVAGPGFINLRFADNFWQRQLGQVLAEGSRYGDSRMGGGAPVNIEYVSANPTGPMHVGHVRGAVFGDALANLLAKAGYRVAKEYYINDAGVQIDVLARSVYLRYREALGEDIGVIPEGFYPGDYLIPVGEALKEKYGDAFIGKDEAEWLETVRNFATEAMMDLIREDLALLGIRHEVFFSEATLHRSGRIDEAIDVLRQRGHIYEGVLEPPKGKKPEDWEPREQTLFRASAFGDDVDRPLKKSTGEYTYFAADIAYHYDKYTRGFKTMVDVLGADHGGYVKRVSAAMKALADDADFDARLCQLVRLTRGGQPVKMSKRAGTFITLRDVVEEVGAGVTRFIMLTRKNDAQLDFDFDKVTEQSKDNPVFYVQYAHARICSVMRKAAAANLYGDISDGGLQGADSALLTDPAEIALLKRMAQWPRMVEAAADAHEPHRIAFYLYELASEFHGLWNKGNDNPDLRFMLEDNVDLTRARLALIRGIAIVIASGLAILGVDPVEEM